MKKQTKALIGILTATSLTVAAVSMMFIHNHEADAKNASFNGIGSIIKSSTEENPFTVVELVPDERMAKFGYFVEGSEPEDWRDNLAKLRTKRERINYMNGLRDRLSLISSGDGTKPLTYTEYKEAYSLDEVPAADEAKYSSFDLATPIEIKKGTVIPYKMVDAAGGSFKLEASFKEQAGGDYDENVVSYEYTQNIDGKHAVKFKKADLSNPDGSIVYRASEIREFHNADEVKVLGFTRYIYRKAKGATGSNVVYEYALSNKDVDGYSFDFTNYDYVLLSFEGVDVSTLTAAERTSGVYYLVESAEYLGGEAEFNGVLNSVERYKKVASGRGHFAVSSEEGYVFVGKGNGSKKFVEGASEALKHDLVLDKVFYTGGFKNNNWFENGVFLKNFSDNRFLPATDPDYNSEKMKIKVVTLTPAGIDAELAANPNYFSNVGLFYVLGSNSLVDGGESYKYISTDDISTNALDIIKKEVNTNNLPAVVENYPAAYSSAPNMLKLAINLVTDRKFFDKIDKDGNIVKEEDADGQFVKKNVYAIEKDFQGQTPEIFKNFATDFINKNSSDSDFVKKAKEVGFGEVAESIVEENDFVDKGVEGTTDNTKKFTLEISKARALEYIISYKMRRKRTTDDVVKILDIEPAKVVGQKDIDSQRMKDKVENWFKPNGKTVTQTSITMPTTEFIGRTEDLSDYDLIYMGLDTSNFNMTNGTPEEKVIYEYTKEEETVAKKEFENPQGEKDMTFPKVSAGIEVDKDTGKKYIVDVWDMKSYKIPATVETISNHVVKYIRPEYKIPAHKIMKHSRIVYKDNPGAEYYTVYNDTKMNGLIYSNIGDIYKARSDDGYKPHLYFKGGLLDTDYLDKNGRFINKDPAANGKYNNIEAYKDADPETDGIKVNFKQGLKERDYHNLLGVYVPKNDSSSLNYRFAGNDITKEKLNKLKDYIESGFPIVFADGFVTTSGSSLIVNDYKIDNCSRMFELVEYAIKYRQDNPSRKNVIFEEKDESLNADALNSLINAVNLPSPKIELEKQVYAKDIDITSRDTDYTKINNRTLEINFKLSNKGFESENAKFKLSLYVDSNADGRFSGKREIVNERYYKLYKDNIVQNEELTASKTSWYRVSYKLPKYFVGIVPWKLKVEQAKTKKDEQANTKKVEQANTKSISRYSTVTGFGYVANNDTPKKIRVLQIKSDGLMESKYNYHYGNDIKHYKFNKNIEYHHIDYEPGRGNVEKRMYFPWNTANTFDMADNVMFNKLLRKVKDFDISIDSIYTSDFAKEYGEWKSSNPGKRPEEYFDAHGSKDQYDMIVLGFADTYNIPNVNNCLDAVQGFINSGKPVLVTHDCSSFINYRGASAWGYDFNRMIRGQAGLDRYGVLNNWALRVGTGSDKEDESTILRKDVYPTIAANYTENSITSGALYVIADRNAKKDKKDIKDIAYVPNSKKKKIAKEVQGYTYGPLIRRSGYEYYDNQFKVFKNQSNDTNETTKVRQINKGQITTYPFKIQEELTVAKTHYQPYQLDFNEDDDEDGESDLIVWYTLDSRYVPSLNWYWLSPKDVRNNYYIYTKGNITYSGVGHSEVTDEEEMKLYINTLIVAYKAAMVPPSIEFKETGDSDAAEKTVSYISYDVSSDAINNAVVTGDKEKVYFTPVDYNSFVKDTNPLQTKVLVKPVNTKGGLYNVYRANGTKEPTESDDQIGECYALSTGDSYYFEVPLSELGGNKNKIDIKVSARTRVTRIFRGSSVTLPKYSPESVSTYIIQKRGLFDLD